MSAIVNIRGATQTDPAESFRLRGARRTTPLVLAMVLIAAAAFKALALYQRSGNHTAMTIAHVTAEWILAVWLLLHVYRKSAWGVALATFTAFAGYSGYATWKGAPSCGCFGAVAIPPWVMLAFDLAAVAALAILHPWHRRTGAAPSIKHPRLWLGASFLSGAALALALALTVPASGSDSSRSPAVDGTAATQPAAFTARPITNPDGSVREYLADLGYVSPDSRQQLAVELSNSTDQDWTLGKPEIQCQCTSVVALPTQVPAKSSARIVFEFHAPDHATSYATSVRLVYTSVSRGAPASGAIREAGGVNLRLTARVGLPLRADNLVWSVAAAGGKKVRLYNDGPKPIRVLYATSSWLELRAVVGPRAAIPAQGQLELPVTVGSGAPWPPSVSLNFQTDCPEQPAISMTVWNTPP